MTLEKASVPRIALSAVLWLAPVGGCVAVQEGLVREVRALRSHVPARPGVAGPVEARGRLSAAALVRSPLGRECVAWRSKLVYSETTRDAKGKAQTTTYATCHKADAGAIALTTEGGETFAVAPSIDLDPELGQRAERRSSEAPELSCGRAGTVVEHCVRAGDAAVVLACARDGRLERCRDGVDRVVRPGDDRLGDLRARLAALVVAGALWLVACVAAYRALLGARVVDPRRPT